ncbi:hypothetical protein Fmac_024979 [Flemingia macrophylla]|uniref:Uncharacterized protein n=1 Tax=Flemingia macrophylla TaxID=520843 RepID=A0ABD1LQW8_9FABA
MNTHFVSMMVLSPGRGTNFHTSFFWNWFNSSCIASTQLASFNASSIDLGSICESKAACSGTLKELLVLTLSFTSPITCSSG